MDAALHLLLQVDTMPLYLLRERIKKLILQDSY